MAVFIVSTMIIENIHSKDNCTYIRCHRRHQVIHGSAARSHLHSLTTTTAHQKRNKCAAHRVPVDKHECYVFLPGGHIMCE